MNLKSDLSRLSQVFDAAFLPVAAALTCSFLRDWKTLVLISAHTHTQVFNLSMYLIGYLGCHPTSDSVPFLSPRCRHEYSNVTIESSLQ